MLEGLWGVVGGSLPEPEEQEGNEAERAQWTRKDNRALAVLRLLLDNSQLVIVLGCETAQDAWEALLDRYEQPTMQNIVLRERKYRNCSMNEGDSMQEHINKHKVLVQDLAAIGNPVPEERQVMELILSLPPSYDSLVNSLQLVQEGLTMKLLTSQLLLEEQKRKERDIGESSAAMYSAKSKFETSSYVGRGKPYRGRGQGSKTVRGCFKCGEMGHIKKFRPQLTQRKSSKRKDEKVCVVDLLAAVEREGDHKWFVDSGASMHMCCSRKYFTTFQEFASEKPVTLPDGNVVYGIGSGNVKWNNSALCDVELKDVMLVPAFSQNLVSVKKMTEKGCKVIFNNADLKVFLGENLVATGKLDKEALYVLEGKPYIHENFAHVAQVRSGIEDWHK